MDHSTILDRARAAEQAGRPELAYHWYVQATELDPNDEASWRGRAQTTTLAEDAVQSWGHAFALKSGDEAARQALAAQIEQWSHATTPADVPKLIKVGRALAETGLIRQANALFQRAAKLDPTSSDALVWQAGTDDNPTRALETLERAIEINPTDERARAGIKALTPKTGTLASRLGVAAEEKSPGIQLTGLLRAGDEALRSGHKGRAYQLFVQASVLAPNEPRAWLGRASATDDVEEGLRSYDQALSLDPDNSKAREARMYLRLKKLRQGPGYSKSPIARAGSKSPAKPGAQSVSSAGGGRLRVVLIILIALFAIFLIAGLYLTSR